MYTERTVGYQLGLKDTLLFGAEGVEPQATLLITEPLVLSTEKRERFDELAREVVGVIDGFDLMGDWRRIGLAEDYFQGAMDLDLASRSVFRYGGIDVYWNNGNPKILEINTRPQVMGFQDTRQASLGISHQPVMIDHFAEWLRDSHYANVYVLGSRRNPFWRGYEWSCQNLRQKGFDTRFGDVGQFATLEAAGYKPDVVWRLVNSRFVVFEGAAARLRESVKAGVPLMNSLSSQFVGDRGFLACASEVAPELFPEQLLIGEGVTDDLLMHYPWVKLDTGDEFSYVVKYGDLRRWGKEALIGLIIGDDDMVQKSLAGRTGGDAEKLREVFTRVKMVVKDQLRWIAQAEVVPDSVELNCDRGKVGLSVLHRVYWFKDAEGDLKLSYEAYAATRDQVSRSKGKINGGSAYAVPVIAK